jgi:hypothetical protein
MIEWLERKGILIFSANVKTNPQKLAAIAYVLIAALVGTLLLTTLLILTSCGGGDNYYTTTTAAPNPVTPIQFCKGYTPTYPNSFPEYGLCINSVLYGVYYASNNVGLVALPTGAYTTTMNNAPCNFTITDGCTVNDN